MIHAMLKDRHNEEEPETIQNQEYAFYALLYREQKIMDKRHRAKSQRMLYRNSTLKKQNTKFFSLLANKPQMKKEGTMKNLMLQKDFSEIANSHSTRVSF